MPAIVLGFNYFLVSSIAVKLNPIHFMGDEIERGNMTHLLEYETIQSIGKKIINFQKEQFKKNENKKPFNKIILDKKNKFFILYCPSICP